MNLAKLTKADLVETAETLESDIADFKSAASKLEREKTFAQKALLEKEKELDEANRKLEHVAHAIIAAAAMKYPDAYFNAVTDYYQTMAEVKSSDESEELLLLKHLHRICT